MWPSSYCWTTTLISPPCWPCLLGTGRPAATSGGLHADSPTLSEHVLFTLITLFAEASPGVTEVTFVEKVPAERHAIVSWEQVRLAIIYAYRLSSPTVLESAFAVLLVWIFHRGD
uniref:Uncharacterized protein n=1 Tax=Podarcis muralis TaxID=64176 RepID=A0A670JD67_PODMU